MKKNSPHDFSYDKWNSLTLEILHDAFLIGDRSWNHTNIKATFNRIYLIIDGEGYIKNENEFVRLQPGYMYLTPVGSCYDYVCTDMIHKFYLHFNLEILPGIDLFRNLHRVLQLPYSQELLTVISEAEKKDSLPKYIHLRALFWPIIYEFFQHGTNETDYMEWYDGFRHQKRVLEYLSKNISASLRIQDISAALCIPSHQLSRSFSRDTGCGLKEYMEQMILRKAHHFLIHTEMTISEISEMLQFTDPFYFSRFFKKYEGVSPREYRRQKF